MRRPAAVRPFIAFILFLPPLVLLAAQALAQSPPQAFDPDNWPGAVEARDIPARYGPTPKPSRAYRFGVVVKFLGNQYWQLLAEGMRVRAAQLGISLDVQAGASEDDPQGQLDKMNRMVDRRYDAILISPQTDRNLRPAVERARKAGILLLNVDDAVLDDAPYFVGPNQFENGQRAARYAMERHPGGGKVAVIRGIAGVYAVLQRSDGFFKTLSPAYPVVAQADGQWDLTLAMDKAAVILAAHPDLIAFYCNNDIMALGVTLAVDKAGLKGQVAVIGTDGILPALDSIRRGGLTATVDSYPYETGMVAVEAALRILENQRLSRVIFSPQRLVTATDLDQKPDLGTLFAR